MVSFEKALFDTNEALHHLQFIPAEKSILLETIVFSFIATALFAPLIIKLVNYLMEKDEELKYIPLGILFFLVVLMMAESIYIIYSNEQYSKIREYIDRIL